HPAHSRLHRDRLQRRRAGGGSLGHECFVHLDGLHRVGPQQQGVGGAVTAQVVVPGPFHDQPESMLLGKANPGGQVACGFRCDRPGAGCRVPSTQPAGGLQAHWLVLDPEGIAQLL
ncbi:hypothetical protein OAE26_01720, partial [Synechococcus sp. AH-551-E05]